MKQFLATLVFSFALSFHAVAEQSPAENSDLDTGIDWSEMTEEDAFYWEIQKDKPAFRHACAVALAGGAFEEKAEIESLCQKTRNTPEIKAAIATLEKAMATMNQEQRERLLNGGAPIGAPEAAVYLAWGKPNNTKRNISKDIVVEQIIFDDRTVFIENGVLTMIQE